MSRFLIVVFAALAVGSAGAAFLSAQPENPKVEPKKGMPAPRIVSLPAEMFDAQTKMISSQASRATTRST